MKNLKVFIIDESLFFRRWFRKLIRALPGIQIIGEAKDPLSALNIIRRVKPDVIIMDIKVQWRFGIDLVKNISKVNPIPRVIMLTSEVWRRQQPKVPGKADFLIDKLTEYNKIPEILNDLIRLRVRHQIPGAHCF